MLFICFTTWTVEQLNQQKNCKEAKKKTEVDKKLS